MLPPIFDVGTFIRRNRHTGNRRFRLPVDQAKRARSCVRFRAVVRRLFLPVGFQQPVQVHDEVTPMRVVDRGRRLAAPCGEGFGIIGIDSNDIQRVQIGELMR